MHRRMGFLFALVAVFLLGRCTPAPDGNADTAENAAATTGMTADAAPAGPSIEGTYRLLYRELPDGTRVDPPAIDALLTFTAEYRNFSLMETGPDGAPVTLNAMSRYTLSDSEYTEELIFRVMTNGDEATYEGPGASGASPVTMDGTNLMWTMPLNEPDMHFMGDTFTATAEGEFVDYWERVN